jgi:hypothetical protein
VTKMSSFNKTVVGDYYAICVVGGCGVLIPVPIVAEQRSERTALDSEIIVVPDISGVEEHFKTVHPELYDPEHPQEHIHALPFKED